MVHRSSTKFDALGLDPDETIQTPQPSAEGAVGLEFAVDFLDARTGKDGHRAEFLDVGPEIEQERSLGDFLPSLGEGNFPVQGDFVLLLPEVEIGNE